MSFFKKIKNSPKKPSNKCKSLDNKRKPLPTLIILSLIFIFVIPLIINGLYQIPAPFPILHLGDSVSVVLELYGNIFSAILGIIGVFISIQYAQKQSQEEYKQSSKDNVRPYLGIELLNSHSKSSLKFFSVGDFTSNSKSPDIKKDDFYTESLSHEHIFVLKNDSIQFLDRELSEEEKIQYSNFIHFPIKITNVGNGASPLVWIKVSHTPQLASDISEVTPVYCETYPLFMPLNSSRIIRICSTDLQMFPTTYSIRFRYTDIFQNCYEDLYSLKIEFLGNYSFQIIELQKKVEDFKI